jgi:decaprenylphospho-beta-D-ribofuranose 2-oxidase
VRCAVQPLTEATVGEVVRGAGRRGVLARGLGRAYGDAAQNSGGVVLLPSSTEIVVDEVSSIVTASSGTSLESLIAALLPRGLFLMVTPGTRHVSVGGAIAADVHGKNHHRDGSFASHVVSLDLVGPDGRTRTLTPQDDPELFWATAGGLGLTGVITRAVLKVRRVESAYVAVRSERQPDLTSVMSRMLEATRTRTYAAAWVDLMSSRGNLGRSVLGVAEHAERGQLSATQAREPLAVPRRARLRVPGTPPVGLVTRASVRAFDALWFRRAPARPVQSVDHLEGFFYPLDAVADWNRLYGRAGLVQYQLAVPDGVDGALEEAVARIGASGCTSFLGVLKRLGAPNRGTMSFPVQGWTLAADFPASPRLISLFRDLDRLVADAGGRVYLAKDSTCGPAAVHRMYPRAGEFRAAREASGAHQVFVSDLSRRLSL